MKSLFKKIVVAVLQWEARMALRKYKPMIVAVTGSVGKTSTKDAIYAVLSGFYPTGAVRKSEKSFNSELGVPLTVLGLPNGWSNPFRWLLILFRGLLLYLFPTNYFLLTTNYPSCLVLEVGADRPGDIKNIAQWLKPDVVVITKFSKVPVHVEFFASPEHVIAEKSELVKALKPDGVLILNADDDDVLELKSLFRNKTITFGFATASDVRGSNDHVLYSAVPRSESAADSTTRVIPAKAGIQSGVGSVGLKIPVGMNCRADHHGTSVPFAVKGSIGRPEIYAALAAIAVGLSRDFNLIEITEHLGKLETPPGRLKLLAGIKNSVIIDDTYNSSPVAAEEALLVLKSLKTSSQDKADSFVNKTNSPSEFVLDRKIVALGDMLELGKHTKEEHLKIGRQAGGFADLLVTVGGRAKDIALGAAEAGLESSKSFHFKNSIDAGKFLDDRIQAGDVVLIKGSQGIRMERTVEEIMAHPELKEKLLVRQDSDWQKKK